MEKGSLSTIRQTALPAIFSDGRRDSFWKDRLNLRAAENDKLPLAACSKIFVLHPF